MDTGISLTVILNDVQLERFVFVQHFVLIYPEEVALLDSKFLTNSAITQSVLRVIPI